MNTKINISLFLCLVMITLNALAQSDLIMSDWTFGDADAEKPVISATELEERPAKIAQLEKEKAEEKQKFEYQVAEAKQKRKALIECLNLKGVQLFTVGDPGCKECRKQDKYFGDDLASLKGYVDCEKERFTCPLRGITAYPTWYLGNYLGIKKIGVRDLESIARATQCKY